MKPAEFTRFALAVHPRTPDFAAYGRIREGAYFHPYGAAEVHGVVAFIPLSAQIAVFGPNSQQLVSYVLAPGQNVKFKAPDLVLLDQPQRSVCVYFLDPAHAETFAGCVNKLYSAHIRCKGVLRCEHIAEVDINFEQAGALEIMPPQQAEIDRLAKLLNTRNEFTELCRQQRKLILGASSTESRPAKKLFLAEGSATAFLADRSLRRMADFGLVAASSVFGKKTNPSVPERNLDKARQQLARSGVCFTTSEQITQGSPIIIDKFRRNLTRDEWQANAINETHIDKQNVLYTSYTAAELLFI